MAPQRLSKSKQQHEVRLKIPVLSGKYLRQLEAELYLFAPIWALSCSRLLFPLLTMVLDKSFFLRGIPLKKSAHQTNRQALSSQIVLSLFSMKLSDLVISMKWLHLLVIGEAVNPLCITFHASRLVNLKT